MDTNYHVVSNLDSEMSLCYGDDYSKFVNHIGHGLRPIPLSHWVAPDAQTILRGEG